MRESQRASRAGVTLSQQDNNASTEGQGSTRDLRRDASAFTERTLHYRRAELWHEQRRQLEMIHDADRQNLQRELEADDRRVKNRILDFLSPARRRERHETPQRALSTSHEKAMNAYLERVKSEREPLDRQYEAQERRLYEQHGQDLAKQERSRIEKAEELARKHELQNKQEKAPAPERSHDLGGRNR